MAVINKSASIGASLTLRATANRGYVFDHWSDLEASSSDYSNTSRTYIVKSSGNALEAIFRPHNLGAIQAIKSSGYTISSGNVLIQNKQSGDLIVDIKVDPNKEWIHAVEVTGLETNEYQIMSKTKTNVVIKFFGSVLRKLHQAIIKLIDRFGSSVTCTATRSIQTSTITINAGDIPTNLFSSSTGTINWSGSTGTLVADQGTPITLTIGDLTGFDVNFVHESNKSNPFTFTPSQGTYNITTTKERLYNIMVRTPDGSQRFEYENRTYELRYPTKVKSGTNVRVDTEIVENVNDRQQVTDFYGYSRALALKIGDKIYGNTITNVTSDIEAMAYYCKQLTVQGAKIKAPWGEIINGEYTILHSPVEGSLPFIRVVDAFGRSGDWEILVETDKVFKGWKLKSTMMSDDTEFEGRDNFPTEGTIYPWLEDRKVLSFINNNCFFKDQVLNSFNEVEYKAYHTSYPSFNGDAPGLVIPSYGPALWPSLTDIDTYLSNWQIDGRPARIVRTTEGDVRDAMATQIGDIFVYDTQIPYPCRTFVFKTEGTYKPIENVVKTFNIVMGPTDSYVTPENSTIRGHNAVLYFAGRGGLDIESNLADNERIIYPENTPFWDLDMLMADDNIILRKNLIIYKDRVGQHIMPVREGNDYVKVTLTEGGDYWIQTYVFGGYRDDTITFDYSQISGIGVPSRFENGDHIIDLTNVYNALVDTYSLNPDGIITFSGVDDTVLVRPHDEVKETIINFAHDYAYPIYIKHPRGRLNIVIGRNQVLYNDTDNHTSNILVSSTAPGSIHYNSFILHI